MYFITLQCQHPPRGFMHPSKHCIDKTTTKNKNKTKANQHQHKKGTKQKLQNTKKRKKERSYNWAVSDLGIRTNTIDPAQLKVLDGVILLRSSKGKAFRSLNTPTTTTIRGIPLNLQLGIKILLHCQHCLCSKPPPSLHSNPFLSLESHFLSLESLVKVALNGQKD